MQPVNSRRIPTTPRLRKDLHPRPENSEIVNYVCNTWNEVHRVYKNKSTFMNAPNVIYYQPEQLEGSNRLPSFERFDLEGYWGMKVFNSRGGNKSP